MSTNEDGCFSAKIWNYYIIFRCITNKKHLLTILNRNHVDQLFTFFIPNARIFAYWNAQVRRSVFCVFSLDLAICLLLSLLFFFLYTGLLSWIDLSHDCPMPIQHAQPAKILQTGSDSADGETHLKNWADRRSKTARLWPTVGLVCHGLKRCLSVS